MRFDYTVNSHINEIWAEYFIDVSLVHYTDIGIADGERIPRNHNNLYGLAVKESSDSSGSVALEGLLLEQTRTLGQFRRFGAFHALDTDVVDIVQAGFQCFDARAKDSGLEYSDDGKGAYKYIIKIMYVWMREEWQGANGVFHN
jgi:hypothetical protein